MHVARLTWSASEVHTLCEGVQSIQDPIVDQAGITDDQDARGGEYKTVTTTLDTIWPWLLFFSFLFSCFTVVYAHHHNILSSGTDRAHPRWNHRVFCAKATTKTAHYWLWFDANICTKYLTFFALTRTKHGKAPFLSV